MIGLKGKLVNPDKDWATTQVYHVEIIGENKNDWLIKYSGTHETTGRPVEGTVEYCKSYWDKYFQPYTNLETALS